VVVLGLSGNIGCGKSSVSNIFKEHNINVVDADIISREILNDKNLLDEVFNTFGESIKNKDGSLNRKALANIVFNNDNELLKLNSLTHPKIREKITEKIKDKDFVVIDAALLIEGGYLDIIDKLLIITCKEDIQIQRIILRDNCSIDEAKSRINSQMSQEEKKKYADFLIDNSGTIDELRKNVENFIKNMKEEFCV
jgi:dephospho-CoA kinase